MSMNPYDLYKKQDLETSNNQELVGKLFNEASLSLKKAMKAIDLNKYDAANDCIKKSQVIVNTLNNSLDMQFEISTDMRRLYTYMLKRMLEANMTKDKAVLEEISGMLSGLRDTWAEAIRRSKKMQM